MKKTETLPKECAVTKNMKNDEWSFIEACVLGTSALQQKIIHNDFKEKNEKIQKFKMKNQCKNWLMTLNLKIILKNQSENTMGIVFLACF